jgi:pimeloyl-ACP methyl ester carboxylesterase
MKGRKMQFGKSMSQRSYWLPKIAIFVAAILCGLGTVATCTAADDAADTKAKEKKIPEPEDLILQTDDGLDLTLTYYRGLRGKESIPVVLLHMWKQSRNDYKELAPALQKLGYAVIVPDLRGHGDSTNLHGSRRDEKLNAATMPSSQFTLMVNADMKAIKGFLWKCNNEQELNIDKLCVVGAEMGTAVALNFALADAIEQDNNPVKRAGYRVGCFVKALVLISPEPSFRGLPIRAATTNPVIQRDIAMLILVGNKEAKAFGDARRICGFFERFHPEPTGDDKNDKKTLFFVKLDTSLQGTKLLDPKFNVPDLITDFLYRRLTKSPESKTWTWQERKVPYGE